MLFSFWLTSLCIKGSRFIHLIKNDLNVFLFHGKSSWNLETPPKSVCTDLWAHFISIFYYFLNLSCLTHLYYPDDKLWRITNHYCVVLCFHTSQNEMVYASINKNYLFFIHFKTSEASFINALIWKSIQLKMKSNQLFESFIILLGLFCFFVLMLNSGKEALILCN